MNPHARIRSTPRSSASVRAEAPDISSSMGGRGRRERKSALAFFVIVDMRGGSYKPKEIPSSVECAVWFLLSCRFTGGTDGQ